MAVNDALTGTLSPSELRQYARNCLDPPAVSEVLPGQTIRLAIVGGGGGAVSLIVMVDVSAKVPEVLVAMTRYAPGVAPAV